MLAPVLRNGSFCIQKDIRTGVRSKVGKGEKRVTRSFARPELARQGRKIFQQKNTFGLGRNPPLAPSVFFWRNSGRTKIQIHHIIKLSRSFLLLCGCPSLKGMHPRHPPRAFPLGLRAPRLLGVLHIPHFVRNAEQLFGERKESSPQRRSPPRKDN